MGINKRHIRRFFVLPCSLLILNALEDLLIYKLQGTIHDPFVLTTAIIALFLAGFSLVGFVISPWIELLLEKSYTRGRGFTAQVGTLISLAIACGVIYWIYYIIYINGVASLANMLPIW